MNFTVEEENLICVYDTTSRQAAVEGIRTAMPDYEEDDMREIAENTLRKLEAMSDTEFSAYIFSPAYYDAEDEETEGSS
jgi:hypothetical protein